MNAHIRWLIVSFIAVIVPLGSPGQATGEQSKGSFERTLKVNGPVQLHIDSGSGDVRVRPGERGTVRVKGIIHTSGGIFGESSEADERVHEIELNPPIQQDGNLIRIGFAKGLGESSHLLFPKYVSIDYEIDAPEETQINSKTGSGDYWISGLKGPATIETGSGDIKMESVLGKIRITAGSGDVVLEGSGAEGIQIETGSGDVVLRLPAQAGYDLSARTSSGDIHVNPKYSETVTVTDNEAHGKLNGGTKPLELRTASGDISID